MSASPKQVRLEGSTKQKPKSAEVVGEAPAEEFSVTVMVRRKKPLPSPEAAAQLKPEQRQYLSREQQAAEYGADPADIALVVQFAKDNALRVVRSDPAQRQVVLSGTPAAFNQAFGVNLKTYKTPTYTYRGREGDIYLPENLRDVVTSVTGLDNRPFARPHFRVHRGAAKAVNAGRDAAATSARTSQIPPGFSPSQIAALYNFPAGLTGAGQTIAILELGGGFRPQELATYFKSIGVAAPNVTAATFPGGGTNHPGTNALDPANPDVEVMLDIQVAGAVAPGAKIVVYFAPDATDQSFLGVMNAIVHDAVNRPSIVSISWGGPEDEGTDQFRNEFDRILQSAAQMGITVCAAAGDNGSADFGANDANWDGHAHVDFPASSPHILACGGTQITASSKGISNEVVWHDGPNDGTGGGVSRKFPLPDYQKNAGINQPAVDPAGPAQRGVPDVAGNAAPASGYKVLCDGQSFPDPAQGIPPVGGTSAVAPLWAGLLALLNQGLGKPVGAVNVQLYNLLGTSAFNDIVTGNNGDYQAKKGWDACTGLGSPNGANLLQALKA
jgi:kumamolisin